MSDKPESPAPDQAQPPPDVIPGFEEFWAPDERVETLATDVQKLPPKFAEGRPMPYEVGVSYKGPWETSHDGVCVAVRRNACALRRTGVPVFLESYDHTHSNDGMVERAIYSELPPEIVAEVGHLSELQHSRHVAFFHHFVPSFHALEYITRIMSDRLDGPIKTAMLKSSAAYIALENNGIPKDWVERLDRFGAIIVPCSANRQWLLDAGVVVPVHVIPHCLGLKDPMRSVVRTGKEDGVLRFLHVGKWEPRKNQHGLIGAFLMAFWPNDKVKLTIKSGPFWASRDYPVDPRESIGIWLQDIGIKNLGWTASNVAQHIEVLWKYPMSRQELAGLYARSDVYVSSGRSEGFDLPALDAKVVGLRMVYVGWGGPVDFATKYDVKIGWNHGKEAPPKEYEAPAGTLWPSYSSESLSFALAEAKAMFSLQKDGLQNDSFDHRPYLIDAVGPQLRAVANTLAKRNGVELEGVKI